MIRLLIADDEPLTLEAVNSLVQRELKSHCTWVGLAADGDEAVRLGEQERANVAILDIQMPGKDGLEVAERLKAVNSDIHIVLLTSYRDFPYAQEAIRLGVQEYLVKPFSEPELLATLSRIFQLVRKATAVRRAQELASQSARRLLVEQLLTHTSTYNEKTLKAYTGILGIAEPPNSIIIAEWKPHAGSAIEVNALLDLVKDILPESVPHWFAPYRLAVLARLSSTPEGQEQLGVAAEQLRGHLMKVLNNDFRVSTVGPVASGAELRNAYAKASVELVAPLTRLPDLADCTAALFTTEGPSQVAHRLADAITSQSDMADLMRWGFGLVAACRDRLIRVSGGSAELVAFEATWSRELLETGTPSGFMIWVRKTLSEAHGLYRKIAPGNTRQIVLEIAAHLTTNYMDDVDQVSLARRFGLSPAHLSRLFKQEIGTNYNAYITETRLKAAEALLSETELSVRVVAKLTGFYSHAYFSTVFKRRFGASPTEYRTG